RSTTSELAFPGSRVSGRAGFSFLADVVAALVPLAEEEQRPAGCGNRAEYARPDLGLPARGHGVLRLLLRHALADHQREPADSRVPLVEDAHRSPPFPTRLSRTACVFKTGSRGFP